MTDTANYLDLLEEVLDAATIVPDTKARHVRTPDGSRAFGLPIGAVIPEGGKPGKPWGLNTRQRLDHANLSPAQRAVYARHRDAGKPHPEALSLAKGSAPSKPKTGPGGRGKPNLPTASGLRTSTDNYLTTRHGAIKNSKDPHDVAERNLIVAELQRRAKGGKRESPSGSSVSTLKVGKQKDVGGYKTIPIRGQHGDYGVAYEEGHGWFAYKGKDEVELDGKYHPTPEDAIQVVASFDAQSKDQVGKHVEGQYKAPKPKPEPAPTVRKMGKKGMARRPQRTASEAPAAVGKKVMGRKEMLRAQRAAEPAASDEEVVKDVLRRLRSSGRGPGGPAKPVTMGELRKLSPSQRALIIENLRQTHRSLGGSMSDDPSIGKRMREIGKLIDKIASSGPVKD